MARRLDHDRIVARERGEQAVSADAESARLARADIRRDRRRRNPTAAEMFDDVQQLRRREEAHG